MSRIIDYPKVQTLNSSGETFLVDHSTDGTRGITAGYLSQNLQETTARNFKNYRNSFYRATDLGTEFTSEHNAALSGSSPNFANMYVGSYWTINGHKYIIADFDYWLGKYDKIADTNSTNDHHIVLIPMWSSSDTPNGAMNDTDTVEGGYLNSKMYTTYLNPIRQIIENDWGDHILTHRECFTNGTTNGYATSHVWVDSTIDLMNECMLHGSFIHSDVHMGYSHDRVTIDLTQLSLFRLYPPAKRTAAYCWLRDIASPTEFASGNSTGLAAIATASSQRAIRPVFAIKAT